MRRRRPMSLMSVTDVFGSWCLAAVPPFICAR
jgi:hypothetical protein